MHTLLKPRSIDVQQLSPLHARVVMEPFERGYGHTLGNALRRILLSSMEGVAPTEVSIEGVLHEYSTLDGVREDVVDVLLNLKGVVLKMHNRREATLTLSRSGEGVVTARDIETTHDIEIVNPDHVIAHIAPGGKLNMQIRVESGRGYVPANQREIARENRAIGQIMLDASFSPVRRVSYSVESSTSKPTARLTTPRKPCVPLPASSWNSCRCSRTWKVHRCPPRRRSRPRSTPCWCARWMTWN